MTRLLRYRTSLLSTGMLLRTRLTGRTSFIGAVGFTDAFDTHVIPADEADTAVRILLTLIFAAHHAALLIGKRLDDIFGFMKAI